MKRIINGKAYNTTTAQAVARGVFEYERRDEEWTSNTTLYRTTGGAFFTVDFDFPTDEPERRMGNRFNLLSYDEAHRFARGEQNIAVEILVEGIFPSAPEAEDTTGAS